MRATGVMRFVIFGAVGFGIGGAITRPLSLLLPGMVGLPLTLLIAGAVGGASLGLALMDWRRVVILAVLGALARIIHERLRRPAKERAINVAPDVPMPDAGGSSSSAP